MIFLSLSLHLTMYPAHWKMRTKRTLSREITDKRVMLKKVVVKNYSYNFRILFLILISITGIIKLS